MMMSKKRKKTRVSECKKIDPPQPPVVASECFEYRVKNFVAGVLLTELFYTLAPSLPPSLRHSTAKRTRKTHVSSSFLLFAHLFHVSVLKVFRLSSPKKHMT